MMYAVRRKSLFFASLLSLIYPFSAFAGNEQEDIASLKEELAIVQDQIEEINQNASKLMSISGYSDLEIHNNTAKDKHPGFRLHHLSLFMEKRIAEKWKFFSEIEYEDAPKFEGEGKPHPEPVNGDPIQGEIINDAKGKLFVEAVNITYQHDASLNIRGGRFFTPAGIWSVDHYPSFVPTQLRPQHIRKIFPQVVDGALVYGTAGLGSMFVDYHLYTGNGEGNTGASDGNSEKAVGVRASIIFPWLTYFELGVSAYSDTQNDDTEKFASGVHFKLEIGDFVLQSEYAKGELEPQGEAAYNSTGYYAQLLYRHNDWTYGVRHDFFEEDDSQVDNGITYDGVFVNYRVNDSVLLKLEHHEVTFDNSSTDPHSESIGSLVVYLGN